ncbi:dynein heavy chain [Achlya hypogyna]|uniref:Dynein heavy chain n=1 Tax=Achlya hypogyna TaxID=1202772 RepID=A0A1V9YQJ1_ACHHY|nr:dynein heavy chain [Achlya hypogyna]
MPIGYGADPEMVWANPKCAGEVPNKRSGHSLTLRGSENALYLFGGCDHKIPPGPSNDLYRLDMGGGFSWMRVMPASTAPEDVPPPRWRHTAVMYNERKLVVFGGFAAEKRMNDCWIFDCDTKLWEQQHAQNFWEGLPQCRGSHTATLVEHKMYIFGGYGGNGYGRTDFNDLHALDLRTMKWEEVLTEGDKPEPRSSHQTCLIENKLFVIGGWNSVKQFHDLFVLDLATSTWSAPDAKLPVPTWNHACVGVTAVPHWKIFMFGGNSGDLAESGNSQGTYLNNVSVLDTGTMQWREPPLKGDAPLARADTAMVYDPVAYKLVLFGGWANRWFGDVYVLHVNEIVGPPYSVASIAPAAGPITGNTRVKVHGFNFTGSSATVRFAVSKGFLDVQGQVLGPTVVQVVTPNFDKYGPLPTEVRVALPGDSYTNIATSFKFHSVTSAPKSVGYGPCLMLSLSSLIMANEPTSFVLQSIDKDGIPRDCGGDVYHVSLVPAADGAEPIEITTITDKGDGRYIVTFIPPAAGKYSIHVAFEGTFDGVAGPIRGSPFACAFQPPSDEMAIRCVPSIAREDDFNSSDLVRKLYTDTTKRAGDYKRVLKELKADIPANDADGLEALKKIKDLVRKLETERAANQLLQEQTAHFFQYMKKSGGHVDKEAADVDNLIKLYHDIQAQVPETEARIMEPTRVFSEKTEATIAEYEAKVKRWQTSIRKLDFWDSKLEPDKALEKIEMQLVEWENEKKRCAEKSDLAHVFGFPQRMNEAHATMAAVRADFDGAKAVWAIVKRTKAFFAATHEIPWKDLDCNALAMETQAVLKELKKIPRDIQWCDAYKVILKETQGFDKTHPLLRCLSSSYMRPRHWERIMKHTGSFTPPDANPEQKLGFLLSKRLHEYASEIGEIAYEAEKEQELELKLVELEETWALVEWEMTPYNPADPVEKHVPLLKISEDNFELLETNQIDVQAMTSSPYQSEFESRVTDMHQGLASVNEVVVILGDIQRSWSYLEPLFIQSEEVKNQLPALTADFEDIDVEVRRILREAWVTKNVKMACTAPGLFKLLESIVEKLELCKHRLKEFLDGRRRQFPRFYFMSEADLLDILSNGSNPAKIMPHASKIYLACKTMNLVPAATGRPTAVAFVSGVGQEVVDFSEPVLLDGEAEIYLEALLQAMKYTLFKHIERSLELYTSEPRVEWINHKDPTGKPLDAAQIILLAAGIHYVKEVEAAFRAMGGGDADALQRYNKKQEGQLEDLIKLTQSKISNAERQRVMCLITMDAHGRDIVANMIRAGVDDASSFMWQSQLKHYFSPCQGSFLNRDQKYRGPNNSRAQVLICDAGIPYDYEYLGNGPRLVITPLTDRIYVTATQALNLKMGCAPAGPAGTGKTETTKDLANALGKACYVFNCSPEMDYKSLGNIFKGLASSGSWGCFDEFNRLVPEVLSVCSVQFKAVCDACKADDERFILENEPVMLDPTVGAFITMNPGYLGRSELPEGLKALFRPMTVMVPDLVLICENMLMAEGFTQAKILASKFYGLYSLLGQLLSKQLHYDWGLRAVKSVLCVAGSFKRAEPDIPEPDLLMRALRDFNIPKIVVEDNVIFFGLLGDLFPRNDPNIDVRNDPPRKRDPELESMVQGACEAINNSPRDEFMLKVVQLSELLAIRHCVFVMGPPASGKTETWKTLRKAREIMGIPMEIQDLNPKSVSTNELYGYIVLKTREWKDGLLSKIMRDLGSRTKENGEDDTSPKWILLDGDLDANWIESMNSVMDDNRMLTLASNERVPLKSHMRMIFEIRDLVYATPATVSRAGILYISATEGYQWRCLIDSWLLRHSTPDPTKKAKDQALLFTAEVRGQFQGLFDTYMEPTLKFFKKRLTPIIPVEDVTLVGNLLSMLDCLLTPAVLGDYSVMQHNFCFCCVWAFGSILTVSDDGTDYALEFSNWWKNTWKDVKIVASASNTVFDFWLDPETAKFNAWSKSPYFYTATYRSPDPINQITVPTTETSSIAFWLENLICKAVPVMVCGPAGTGKTQNVNGVLKKLSREDASYGFRYTTLNFNFYTTSAILQAAMFSHLEKKTGSNFGPPGKFRLIYFMDDLNLPEVDPYNTQSAISLLRQKMEYRHWFDRAKLQVQNILNTQIVAGMNPTAGSFLVDPRLQRHFTTFAMGMPEAPSLVTIYETFLGGHLGTFSGELNTSSFWNALIKAALTLHTSVVQTFRKTAANFHYEFNVRHLSNVFQGLIASKKERFQTAEKFVLLWLHESERVYGDRLVCKADIEKYNQLVQLQVKRSFPTCNTSRYYAAENSWPLIYCHFTKDGDPEYDQVNGTNLDDLKKNLEIQLREYNNNENNTAMYLDLFDDAIKHVARIVRILRNESGHALLVGVGGSGKRSLARLASHICEYTVKQISISSKYGENEFKEDLRKMYMVVVDQCSRSEEKGGVVFLLTDSQITNEKFLIYLNDLLASGDIPDLFATEDMDNIVQMVCVMAGTKERKEVVKFFQSEIRKRLHLCLCFSPVGDDFRSRARKFPALVNCTVIDWFQPWPKEALLSVGKEKLKDISDLLGSDESRAGIENFMPFSFVSVNQCAERFFHVERRYVYTTPKSYLELLQLYKNILKKKVKEYAGAIERLEKGLQKLKETGETVARLEVELKGKLEQAEDKKAVASGISETVNKEKAKVEVESKKAEEEAAKCAVIQAEVTEKQRSTMEDLAKAEPAVQQAMEALDSLNKKDLGECKTMSKPPTGVDDVFGATMVLLAGVHPNVAVTKQGKVKDFKWDACKKQVLGNIPEYIEYLIKFKDLVDAGQVPTQNWKEVREFLEKEHFKPDIIMTKNKAAAGLCSWVVNIVMYYDILVTVEPKRMALAAANLELEAANKRLNEVTSLVADLNAKLNKLLEEAAAAEKEKEDAVNSVEQGNRKMKLAGTLTKDLSSENVRWGINVLQLQKEKDLLVGDCLLASAFISYIGPFTKPFRDELINKHWVPYLRKAANGNSIAMSEESNPVYILTNDAEIAEWNTQRLPADRVSTENGAIVVNTVAMGRRPLIIDPQLQAIAWIREKEAPFNLQIVRIGQKYWIDKLKTALGTKTAFLIENLGEKIDAILAPVIQRSTSKRGNRIEITVGDASVPYCDEFRLYLHTKLGNPHYPPEIQAECTMVNFTVTALGLEDQLLNLVVSKERSDLAVKREKLIQQQNQGKIELKKLEDIILQYLAEADDDITNNQPLIAILSDTKYKAQMTQNNMEAAKKTQESVNVTSEKYRSIAARGSLLFFLMIDLSKVHSYYIYSLAAFQQVFLQGVFNLPLAPPSGALDDAPTDAEGDAPPLAADAPSPDEVTVEFSDEDIAARCKGLIASITMCVFNYIRRGLFERDKLTVATMLCLKILLRDGGLIEAEVDALLLSRSVADPGNMGVLAEWLPSSCFAKLKALETLKVFANVADVMQNDPDEWRKWFAAEDAEQTKLPGDYAKLTPFQKIILLRALRPDRVTNALRRFILDSLGEQYVTQPPFNMLQTFEETTPAIPIFFVLFPGVDPTPWVEDLGRTKGVSIENDNFINISMGQGQEQHAGDCLKKLATKGGWIILQNVHLMQSWLPLLERQLEEIVGEGPHELFRCFISAEPPPILLPLELNVPESLMQSCIKVANEAPSDIQSNLRRAWATFGEDKVDACTKPTEFKACLFSLCWFHAIVLGRRRFGQQGWSRAYSFNTGDLTICGNVLQSYLDNNATVPWDDLRYIFGEIMYGGHITDSWDRRTNNTYLTVLINPGLLAGMELGPGFKSPNPTEFSFQDYAMYIEKNMVPESPPLFGLHPNAEIGYLTTTCETLCYTIVSIGGGGGGSGGGGADKTAMLKATIDDFEARTPEFFMMLDLQELAAPGLTQDHGPFVVVALQECDRMNGLLDEIRKSLADLKKGLNGQLNMSQAMEDLATAIGLNEVPGRNPFSQCKWEKKAWPSKKSLSGWFVDMIKRHAQLLKWSADFITPFSLWLPGLFNPTAYTTACLQVTSRRKLMPLNKMTVETHMTTVNNADAVTYYPDDGVFVHGLFIEGARWSTVDEIATKYKVGASPATECGGVIMDSNPKELLWMLPVVYVKAVETKPLWEPTSVGYLRHDPEIYECPVYLTRFRGPTYVLLATLPTDCGQEKWVLRGVAVLFQDDN